jgi:2-oxoisovalerate dehydrogenase E1 component beta subunit
MLPLSHPPPAPQLNSLTPNYGLYWRQVLVAQQAAERAAAQHGISCEVLDLRTLLPWDREAVAASVAKTGRLIVTHEAPVTSGFGAEVVAAIVGHNKTFLKLEAPPLRVCGQDTPFPLVFEPLYLPGVERLLEAVVATAQY